ncbi:hypothetical protein [Arthrobacter roseus]|uniref:hypothetical protein n=1 Tax=Arthrobacter roseus TaxID=136274 RepID=UPI0019630FAB|nr:hypothetical protein [Arthrobacter roseus]MBM7847438.1 hypothetical protein [Arthrobacter roseus]
MPVSANADLDGAGYWVSLAALGQEPHLSEAEKNSGPSALGTERVVAMGALCEFSRDPQEEGALSFFVTEFVRLDVGKVINVDHRGFSLGPHLGGRTTKPRAEHESVDSMVQLVLNTALPDDDEVTEDPPWEWLAHCARDQCGVWVS